MLNKRSMTLGLLLSAASILASSNSAGEELAYVVSVQSGVSVVDVATNTELTRLPLEVPGIIGALPNGRRVYVPDRVGLAAVDTATQSIVATVDLGFGDGGSGRGAAALVSGGRLAGFTPDSEFLYVPGGGPAGTTVAVVDTIRNEVVDTVSVPFFPGVLTATPDGASIYVVIRGNEIGIVVIDVASNEVVSEILFDNSRFPESNVVFDPNGGVGYVTLGNTAVALIDTNRAEVVEEIFGCGPSGDLAISPDGAVLYVAEKSDEPEESDDAVCFLNVATRQVDARVPVGRNPRGLALTPDGRALYVPNESSDTVSVIDTTTKQVTATIAVGVQPVDIVIVDVPPPEPTPTSTATPTLTPTRGSGGGGCTLNAGDGSLSPWPLVLLAFLAFRLARRAGHRTTAVLSPEWHKNRIGHRIWCARRTLPLSTRSRFTNHESR